MATIVTFVPRAPATRIPPPAGTTGSVIFFTGVRYEKADAASKLKPGDAAGAGTTSKPN